MPSPLFLIALLFCTIIVVGSLLVAVNDWLEARQATPEFSGAIGVRRSGRPLFAGTRRRMVRSAIRFTRQKPQAKGRDLIVDWF